MSTSEIDLIAQRPLRRSFARSSSVNNDKAAKRGKATSNTKLADEDDDSELSNEGELSVVTDITSERIVGMPRAPWTPSRELDKTKTLTKRMGYMMKVLDMEQQVNSENFSKFPQFSAGDVLEVDLVSFPSYTK